jgi:hypothetical protein
VNRLDSDPLIDAELIALLAMRFNGLPAFLKTRIDQQKKKETIRTYYVDDVLNKYMEINECGIREVEEDYAVNKTELDNALKLIKSNFFNIKEKVIVNKNTDIEEEKEKSLFLHCISLKECRLRADLRRMQKRKKNLPCQTLHAKR